MLAGSAHNTVVSNRIGTNRAGNRALGNRSDGINLTGGAADELGDQQLHRPGRFGYPLPNTGQPVLNLGRHNHILGNRT